MHNWGVDSNNLSLRRENFCSLPKKKFFPAYEKSFCRASSKKMQENAYICRKVHKYAGLLVFLEDLFHFGA